MHSLGYSSKPRKTTKAERQTKSTSVGNFFLDAAPKLCFSFAFFVHSFSLDWIIFHSSQENFRLSCKNYSPLEKKKRHIIMAREMVECPPKILLLLGNKSPAINSECENTIVRTKSFKPVYEQDYICNYFLIVAHETYIP